MAPKMYLLVEADQSKDDPISKLMTQLVDQLKSSKSPSKSKCEEIVLAPSKSKCHEAVHLPSHSKCEEVRVNNQHAAITAEACIDPSGCTRAKILVSTEKPRKTEEEACPKKLPASCPKAAPACNTELPCGRRNGLDPTFAEQRGQKKFQYLPIKSKIPDYESSGRKCPKPLIMPDNLSQASSGGGCDYRGKLTPTEINRLRQTCAKSLTEARLTKYGACIKRRDGLQDQCDPLSRRVLRNCCRPAKKC